MTQQHDTTPPPATPSDTPKRKRRFLTGLLAGTVLGGLLAGGLSAYSHHGPGGCWHGGGHFGHRSGHDPKAMAERMEFAADWVLKKVNASEQQKQQVNAILNSTLNDLLPLRDEHRVSRQAMISALAQPAVDRQALESIRRAELERAQSASTRIVQALADIADVLTPQQRAELAQYATRFQH